MADAHRGAGGGGLDEHRQGEGGPHGLHAGGGGIAQGQGVDHRQASLPPDFLGLVLVHGQRAGEHAGAHVGQAGHLQQPLDGPVLPEGAVQHREHHVRRDAAAPDGQPAAGHHADGASRGDELQALPVAFPAEAGAGLQVPDSRLVDADQDLPVAGGVQVARHGGGGAQGHFVLPGAPSEQQADGQRLGTHG